MCAGNAVFYHTDGVSESKIAREMMCFTIETVAGGCEGGRCETAVAGMLAYGRLCSPMVAPVPLGSEIIGSESHCNGGVWVALGGWFAALC